jgi:outer membrane protein assembly factor BamB
LSRIAEAAAVAAVCLLGPVITVGPACAQSPAASFRGGPAHLGVYPGPGIRAAPKVAWRFQTAGRVFGSPAIEGETVFIGSTDGFVYALDRASGELRWKHKTGARVSSSPAVAGGRVFVASYDGLIYALDAATGATAWSFKTGGERRFAGTHLHGYEPAAESMPDAFDVWLSSPAVWRDLVVIGSGDGHVYGLDARSGQARWRFRTGDVVHASPAIADGVVYIGSWDGVLYALEAASGAVVWKLQTGRDENIHNQVGFQGSASVSDGTVYVGCRDAHLYAVDARTGKIRWSYGTKGSWVSGSPAVAGGHVYFGTSDTHTFFDLDARTGAVNGSVPLTYFLFASPALAGGLAYVGSWDGKLTAIDLATRMPSWVWQTDASRRHLAEFQAKDGSVEFSPDGEELWYDELMYDAVRSWKLGGLLSSPVVANGVLYIGSTDGNLYALR